jgi:3-hydroxyacyl-[acyl-carrier-protein] dehydratase
MAFCFVDRLLEVVPGQRASGLKNVTLSEPGLLEPAPGHPVFPLAHTAEAIAHLISWLVIVSLDFRAKPIAVTTERMTFEGFARPGDQLRLEASIQTMREDSALCSGRALLEGKTLASLEGGICAFVPLEELEDEALVRARYRFLLGQAPGGKALWAPEGLESRWPLMAGQLWPYPLVDKVVEFEPGRRLVALKAVSRSEAALEDHFPRRPVLPGTIMAEALGQAGMCLLDQGLPEASGPPRRAYIRRLSRVRFRRFLHPGDLLEMEARVVRWDEAEAELRLTGRLEGQEAIRCQALYGLEASEVPEVLFEARRAAWRARFSGPQGG